MGDDDVELVRPKAARNVAISSRVPIEIRHALAVHSA